MIYEFLEFPTVNGVEVCLGDTLPIMNQTRPNNTDTEPLLDFNELLPTRKTTTTNSPLLDFNIRIESTTAQSVTTPVPIPPTEDPCLKGFTREDVQNYWKSSKDLTQCPKSITNAVFLDQLKRFAVMKMDGVFSSRRKSLEQMSQLIQLIRDVMVGTCPGKAVAREFLDIAVAAFTMFIKEDFFYGVEELESVIFERFKFILNKCIKRAQAFTFSMKPLDCEHSEVSLFS